MRVYFILDFKGPQYAYQGELCDIWSLIVDLLQIYIFKTLIWKRCSEQFWKMQLPQQQLPGLLRMGLFESAQGFVVLSVYHRLQSVSVQGFGHPVCLSQAWVHNHYGIILSRYVSISYLPLLVTRPQRCQLENIGGFVNVKTYSLNIYECWGVLLQMSKDSLYFSGTINLISNVYVNISHLHFQIYVCLMRTEFSPKFMPVF